MRSSLRKLSFVAFLAVLVLIGIRVIEGLSTYPAMPPKASTATTSAKPTPTGGGTGRIAFVTEKNQIYTSNADGLELTHLADMEFDPWQLQWSPDGEHLALRSMEGNVYVMKADGSNSRCLAKTEGVGFFHGHPMARRSRLTHTKMGNPVPSYAVSSYTPSALMEQD